MKAVEVVLHLHDDVARRARAAGLLRPERIVELIEREIAGTPPEASYPSDLQPENRRFLDFLDAWMAEPDEHDDDWWDEFQSELADNRFSVSTLSNE